MAQEKKDIIPNQIIIRHRSGSKANQVEEFPLENLTALTIGRTATSMIKYDPDQDDLVSREHAKIEYRHGKFVFSDQSTNGTYLTGDAGAVHLRRESIVLSGSGQIGLGRRPEESAEPVSYSVVASLPRPG